MLNFNTKLIIGFLASFCATSLVLANPVLGNVAAGTAVVHSTPNVTTIHQTSQQAIINWQSFNIGSQQATHFFQPVGGIALNRISPTQGASQIYGSLTATGQIILVNPAGIYFGPNSVVNVGGLIATTSNITDANFLKGKYIFNQPSSYQNASIINEGSIIAANHGLIALVGPSVRNDGLIQANLGAVVLASGNAFTVNFAGNDTINFAFKKSATSQSGSVTNTGSIIADGGTILVTAQQASSVLDNVINLSGVIEAKSVYQQDGDVIISGDPKGGVVDVAADIDASGNLMGGNVAITGYNILLDNPALINVSGNTGGGSVKIGGDYHGQGTLPHANALVMMSGAVIDASAIQNGNGGNVVLWSDNYTNAMGTILAKGGSQSGNGGSVETSSAGKLAANNVSVNTSAPNGSLGTWLLDPTNIYIASSQANATTAGMTGTDTSVNSSGPSIFTASGAVQDSLLLTGTLTSALGSNNVTVSTTNASGIGAGDINVVNAISWSSGNNLTLTATRNIILNANITNTGGASVKLISDNTGTGTGTVCGAGSTLCGGTPTGTVTLSGGTGKVSVYYNPTTFGTVNTTYTGGTTPTNYELINQLGAAADTTTRSLASVSNNTALWTQNFALAANIDATATSGWNAGAGFSPIGSSNPSHYSGNFDGQGFTISNLFINRPSTGNVGLFGFVNGGSIRDVSLTNVNITGGGSTGALVGAFNNATISSSGAGLINITGSVTGVQFVGGLVGQLTSGTLTSPAQGDITVSANVTGAGNSVGGIIGLYQSASSLSNLQYTNGTVVNSNINTGGLVGGFLGTSATLSNSFVSGATVHQTGASAGTGGLVGSLSTGTITSTNLGLTSFSGTVIGGNQTGALVGSIGGGGGIIAPAQGYITATGTLTLNGNVSGGLVGLNGGTITNLTNTINVVGGNNNIGGIVGANSGSISNVYNSGNVTVPSIVSNVGGITGNNSGTITNAYNTGTISSEFNAVGGIAGLMSGGTLNKVYNLGAVENVSGHGVSNYGGIVGSFTGGTITNAYNNGLVDIKIGGGNGNVAGGIIGSATLTGTTIGFLYNTGYVLANSGTGGLIGSASGTPTFSGTSYFNLDTSGQTVAVSNLTNANLAGAHTGAMQTQSTFSGWDFSSIWSIIPNTSYPYLQAFYSATPTIVTSTSTSPTGGLKTVLAVNGTAQDFSFTGANGASYFLEGNNLISGINLPIATGANLFLYYTGGSTVSNAIAQAPGGQMGVGNGFTLNPSTVTAGLGTTAETFTNTSINTIVNGNANALFSLSGNNLILNSGDSFAVTSPSTYSVVGNLTTSNGGEVDILGALNGNGNAFTLTTGNTTNGNTIVGTISNLTNLTYAGTDSLALFGNNTYTGTTSVTGGGVLIISADDNLGIAPSTPTPGSLTLSNGSTLGTSASFTLNSNRGIALGSGGGGFEPAAGTTFTYGGIIAGSSPLILNNSGTLILTGANTYSGGTHISAGILSVSADDNLGTAPVSATPGNLAFNGGTLETTAGFTLNSNRGIALGASGGTIQTDTGTDIYNGIIAGSGALTKTGSGTLQLGGANTYNGATNVNAGTLVVANASALGSTLGGTIVNSGAVLTLSGVNIGNENLTLNGATLNGTGTSGLTGTITLGSGTTDVIDAEGGTMTLGGAVDGTNVNLTLEGAGSLVLGANIGSVHPLSNLTFDTALNLGTDAALTATNIQINDGVNGIGHALTATGTDISIAGTLALQNLTVNGTGSSTFTLDSGSAQTWTLTGTNSGTVDSSGITGSATFSNIQNIAGNNEDNNFVLAGGSLTGNIDAGSGTTTITGGSGALVWNITGTNTVSVTGIGGTISNIRNLMGGSGGNTFIFADGATISGSVSGGSLANPNTLDFQAYSTPVTVTLSSSNQYNGTAVNSSSGAIASYTNINNLEGNTSLHNILSPTSAQRSRITLTSATSGTMGDPLTWTGFSLTAVPTPAPATTTDDVFNSDISGILQQPDSLGGSSAFPWILISDDVSQNLNDLISQASAIYDTNLSKVKINPYCDSAL